MVGRAPRIATYTHAGRRSGNQDAVLSTTFTDGSLLLAVADGMGGHLAGEIASATALEALHSALGTGVALREAFHAANDSVLRAASGDSARSGMGTTLVGVLFERGEYRVGNVGDSRAYRMRGDRIEQVTDDHSFIAEAIREGSMSPHEAARSPWRNALTRAIGTERSVQVDVFGPIRPEPGEVLLLCSDGLYKSVPEDMLLEVATSTENVDAAVQALGALAFRRGSDDNISAVMVEFGTLSRRGMELTVPVPVQRSTPGRG